MGAGGRNRVDYDVSPVAAMLDDIIARHGRIAVAVSGGSDSIALMHLIAARDRATLPVLASTTIVTVDHRLRPGASEEARRVGEMARAAGFHQHVILTWSGPHPATGIQAAARDARYGLLGGYCREHGIAALLTAHTRDDQAETVLMRLARGTGVDGLGGMTPIRWLDGVRHYRPLLGITRAELQSYLASIGATWIDDPSNDNPTFERIRWRQARDARDAVGLTDQALALTASRAGRAAEALDWAVGREVRSAGAAYQWNSLGFAVVSKVWLSALPEEFRLRILGALVAAVGGQAGAPPLGALESACKGLCNPSSPLRRGFTLHGAMVRVAGDRVTILREAIGGRRGVVVPPEIGAHPIDPGDAISWDRRFAMHLDRGAPGSATVGPLGSDGLATLRSAEILLPVDVPARVLWALPVVDFPTLGRAVPHLGVWPAGIGPEMVDFGPLRVPFDQGTKNGAGFDD